MDHFQVPLPSEPPHRQKLNQYNEGIAKNCFIVKHSADLQRKCWIRGNMLSEMTKGERLSVRRVGRVSQVVCWLELEPHEWVSDERRTITIKQINELRSSSCRKRNLLLMWGWPERKRGEERGTERHAKRDTRRETHKQTSKQTNNQTHRQADSQRARHPASHPNSQSAKQTNTHFNTQPGAPRHTDRQNDKHNDRQNDTHTQG